ncbi:MAG: hypothetical protein JNL10_09490 [Verrucomicrobiales bacterium]|nr:hypothetical protein [Verrucomicrobiales bacterium]
MILLAGWLAVAGSLSPGCTTASTPEGGGWDHLKTGMSYTQVERVLAGTKEDMTGPIEEARVRQRRVDDEYWEMVSRSKFAGASYIPPRITTVVIAQDGRRLVFDKDHLIGWSRD